MVVLVSYSSYKYVETLLYVEHYRYSLIWNDSKFIQRTTIISPTAYQRRFKFVLAPENVQTIETLETRQVQ
jgi:hypothetical protein